MMKPNTAASIRAATILGLRPSLRTPALRRTRRHYATQNELGSRRRAVTPFNDDGHVPWTQLSVGEKTGRAAQQTFNLGMVLVGIVMTGGVGYVLYQEVFSADSKVAHFNRAVDRIKKDPSCLAALGDSNKITAHGEETANKWRRARPITATSKTDPQGNDHMMLHFYVEGPLNRGVANLHLVKRPNQDEYAYRYFYVDVPGHQRIYLEREDAAAQGSGQKKLKFFGVSWS